MLSAALGEVSDDFQNSHMEPYQGRWALRGLPRSLMSWRRVKAV